MEIYQIKHQSTACNKLNDYFHGKWVNKQANISTNNQRNLEQQQLQQTNEQDQSSNIRKPCNCTKSMCLKLY